MLAIGGIVTMAGGGCIHAAERTHSASAAADLTSTLGALEDRSYAAWKSKDVKFWATFLSDRFVGWGRSGRLDKRAATRLFSGTGCRIDSYRLMDQQVSRLTSDAAVLTHRTETSGTCDGRPVAPATFAATVYVRESGRWRAAFRAQSALVDPLKATRPADNNLWTGGPSRNDPATRTLLAREQAVWTAWQNRDARRIDTLLGDPVQFIDIFGNHIGTRPDTLKAWSGSGCDITRFDLGGAKATMLTPDVGILTVRATTDGKCFGQDVWTIWGTTIYVRHGRTWLWSFGINVLAGAASN